MTSAERNVLILGDELSFVDRYAPLLRRSNLTVRKVVRPSDPGQLPQDEPQDLLVLVLPIANADKVLGSLRAEGSPWRNTGVLMVADRTAPSARNAVLGKVANRIVPVEATAEQFQEAVSELLHVAPRLEVRATVRLRLAQAVDETRSLEVENLSASGMLLRGEAALPVGSVFGFALDLPSQPDPIRGQAGVVRRASSADDAVHRIGVRFLSIGGDGVERIARLTGKRAANDAASSDGRERSGAFATTKTGTSGVYPRPAATDLRSMKRELAEINTLIDDLLRQGLTRRLGVADYYLTGMELGLESLRSFAAVLETAQAGRAPGSEAASRIADLAEVRRKLSEFALPQQDLRHRVKLLVEIRPAMDRLVRELVEANAHTGELSRGMPAVVSQISVEIKRLYATRKSLEAIRVSLVELGSLRYLVARGAQRRLAERLCADHKAVSSALGFDSPERLLRSDGRKAALAAVRREVAHLDQRLAALHERVYLRKYRHSVSGNVERDLLDVRSTQILADMLTAGQEYLARAYSAYRHALELAGADAGLLDRAGTLAATIRAAEREQSGAFRTTGSHPIVRS